MSLFQTLRHCKCNFRCAAARRSQCAKACLTDDCTKSSDRLCLLRFEA